MYRQRPVKGGREPLGSAVLKSIWGHVDKDARLFDVGRSFVVATILAQHYGIKRQEDYKTVDRRRK